MKNFESWLDKSIEERKEKNLYRELKYPQALKDFCSNDYLGLARSSELHNNILDKVASLPIHLNGATGSRLLSGNSVLTEEVESKLSKIFKSQAALIFNSGYTANIAVISSLPQRNDTIIYDELSHASIKDGARLGLANRFSFKHNNLNDLEEKIKRAKGKVYIIVESIYSMDGDECPLLELTTLAERHDATIILDEAHSTGVRGENGAGLAVSLGIENKIGVRIYTFGKAMGCHGACVAGSKNLISYLINFSRPFIYTTALPQHSIVSIDCAFEFLAANISLQQQLTKKIEYFNTALTSAPRKVTSTSAIQVIIIPGNDNVRKSALTLQSYGFDVRPILSPTVPVDAERLRICLHSFNEEADINSLTNLIMSLH